MLHRSIVLACGVSVSAICGGASAQSEDPLTDEIVVVGNRLGTVEVTELTSPVTVIETELDSRGQGALSSVLRTVPGLSVSRSGSSSGLTQLRLRGAEANQIVVLIDGVEVANPNDGAFDFGGLRADTVARVEVLRGEQSALYGADAIGGVINIITKAGATTRESWNATVEAGSRDSLEGTLSATVPLGQSGAGLSVLGNAFRTDGYDISGLGADDGASSRTLDLGLSGVAIGAAQMSGKLGYTTRNADFDEDSDFDGRLDDTNSESTVETRTARADARATIAGIATRASVSRLETETDTRAGFASSTTGRRTQASLIASRGFGPHMLTALTEWEEEEYRFDGDPDTPSNDTWSMAGDYRFGSGALTLTGSARHDSNDLLDDATTWRAGAGYGFDWDGRLTASIGTGVKNPTLIELFGFFPSARFVGNPDLQPETSLGYNIGYRQGLGERGHIAVNYFRSDLEDEIATVFNPDFTSSVINLATDSSREGVELEGRYRIGDLALTGAISFLDSDQDGVEEVRRPGFTASATATYTRGDAEVSVFLDHTGTQRDTEFATFTDVDLDAFTLVGAKADYDFGAFGAYVRAENLLDEDYEELVGYRSPGRAVFVGLRARY